MAVNPYADPEPAATREQADQQNTIGNRNRRDTGQSYWQEQTQQQAVQQAQQQRDTGPTSGIPMKYPGWERDAAANQQQLTDKKTYYEVRALLDARNRPGYNENPGDQNTIHLALEKLKENPGMTYTQAEGLALNEQYQRATQTPGVKDDLFFLGESDKWKQNKVELSSAYHDLGMRAGVPIPANKFEYSGDLAVEALKGSPKKRSEFFSPVSGEMSQYLPGGRGSQDVGWDIARSQKASPADFTNAINYLNAAEGKYGPYGKLFGGIDNGYAAANRNAGNTPIDSFGGRNVRAPFISGSTKTEIIEPTGEVDLFGFKATIPFLAAFQPTQTKTTITGRPNSTVAFEGDQEITTTSIPVTTIFSPGKSQYDVFQENISDKLYSGIGSLTGMKGSDIKTGVNIATMRAEIAGNTNPAAISTAFGAGMIKESLDRPVEAGVNLGVAFAGGMAFRGIEAGAAPIATRMIARGGASEAAAGFGSLAWKQVPSVMAGMYGASVAERSTQGFANYKPGSVSTRAGGIFAIETVPMSVGFMGGYKSPDIVYRGARQVQIDYLSMKQEAKSQNLANIPTTGRAGLGEIKYNIRDYVSFKGQKLAMETQGRAAIFGENLANSYAEARVMTKPRAQIFAQNTVAGIYGRYFEAMGYGKYGREVPRVKSPVEIPTSKQPFTAGPAPTRIGSKTVGGRQVSGLRPEPSLKSMGITETSGGGKSGSPFAKERSIDYRNMPRGSMKRMDTKQSAILFPQEQIPRAMPPQARSSVGPVQASMGEEVTPIFGLKPMFSLESAGKSSVLFGSVSLSESISSQVQREGQRQQFDQMTRQRATTPGFMSMRAVGVTTGQELREKQGITSILGSRSGQAVFSSLASSQAQSVFSQTKTATRTTQRTDQITKPWQDQIINQTPKAGGMVLPFMPGGSSGGRPFMQRGLESWRFKNPTTTIPYLSAGGALFGGKKRKKGKFPF